MQTNIVYQGFSVHNRLRELGLSVRLLTDIVSTGDTAHNLVAENDPSTAAGFLCWAWTVRALRDALIPLGWRKCDDQNFAKVISPSGRLSIVVASGDQWTGSRWATPNVRSRKGRCTQEAVQANQLQLGLPLFSETAPRLCQSWPDAVQTLTWYLLIARHGANVVHSELSLPAGSAISGRIGHWEERILLPPVIGVSQGTFRSTVAANADAFDRANRMAA